MEKPKVSVIIPTYNSGATLANCLESIRNQSYSSIEVIIVDSLSNDATRDIAAEFGTRVIRQKSTPSLARNIGIANSTGKYLFFIDSDQVLSASVIEECIRNCEVENAGMVRVPEVSVGESFWGSCSAAWKNSHAKVEQEYGTGGHISVGEPRFFVKEQIVQAGMFNNDLFWGEDYDLYRRMRKMNIKETLCRSRLYHYEPSSIKKILFKILRYSISMPTYARRTGQSFLWPIISQSLLTFKELLKQYEEYPAIIVGCEVLLCLKTYFITFGLVIGSLSHSIKGVNGNH